MGQADVVIEVGPGLGSLTLGLLPAARRVVAVEIDRTLAGALPARSPTRAPELADRLDVVHADALRVDGVPGAPPTVLVANLPTTSPSRCAASAEPCSRPLRHGLIMVQAEVADRLIAAPGSRVYGVPSR